MPGPATAASTGTAVWGVTPSDAPREAPPVDPTADDFDHAIPAPQGRAARRRQQARWKKTQRRALVATAVALVGGGLTVLSMDRQPTDKTQAATAPDVTGMGGAQETTDQHTRPDSTPPTTRGTSRTQREQAPAADDQRRRPAPASTPTTPPNARPDAATVPRTPVTPQPRITVPTSVSAGSVTDQTGTGSNTGSGSDSGTAAQPTPAPPAAGDNGGSDSGSSQTSPDPAATSPTSPQLCVLVICLG
ncbi:hypothetical protein [Streptomyces sp. SA15]|uniref:SCO2400 family protein n=1 Tax=Streptomyces sp. SA15 TaxID=934019 RepID=UPI0027B96154|nr:hypothetical protein [Streptomyces sp. SA15]